MFLFFFKYIFVVLQNIAMESHMKDEITRTNTGPNNINMCFPGISMIVRVLGPVMGFMLGGKCLSIWIDPTQDPKIDQMDPRWLGAWWLGNVIVCQ